MVVFTGADAYVSPALYPSKAKHGRVVPTWNYEAAHVYGRLIWHEDKAWLRANVAALTDRFERGRAAPWTIDDAPEAYVQGLLGAIIGVELRITRVQVKRKLSQNRSAEDRAGVVAALGASAQGLAVAKVMAALEDDPD
jgi:transcriptional regulator